MVDPESNEESWVVIVPLSEITAILATAGLGIKISGISIDASKANMMPKLIMMALFFTLVLLSVFL
jgi:hypothetical protein